MSDKEMVPVSETQSPVTVLDLKTMNPIQIGVVVSRIYEGESVQRHEYYPGAEAQQYLELGTVPNRPSYRLGTTTTEWQFTDHMEALDPLLQVGYLPKKQYLGRGGLSLYTMLEAPDPVVFRDPVDWDIDYWNNAPLDDRDQRLREVREAVIVQSAIRPKKGISYHHGWWRMICTNGLMSEVLGLETLKMSHLNFDSEKVEDFASNLNSVKPYIDGDVNNQKGPLVGNLNGIRHLLSIFRQLSENPTIDADGLEDEDEDQVSISANLLDDQALPWSVKQALSPIINMNRWYNLELCDQFEMMINYYASMSGPRQPIYAFDLLNAISNPLNYPGEHAVMRGLMKSPGLFKTCANLVGTFSLLD